MSHKRLNIKTKLVTTQGSCGFKTSIFMNIPSCEVTRRIPVLVKRRAIQRRLNNLSWTYILTEEKFSNHPAKRNIFSSVKNISPTFSYIWHSWIFCNLHVQIFTDRKKNNASLVVHISQSYFLKSFNSCSLK